MVCLKPVSSHCSCNVTAFPKTINLVNNSILTERKDGQTNKTQVIVFQYYPLRKHHPSPLGITISDISFELSRVLLKVQYCEWEDTTITTLTPLFKTFMFYGPNGLNSDNARVMSEFLKLFSLFYSTPFNIDYVLGIKSHVTCNCTCVSMPNLAKVKTVRTIIHDTWPLKVNFKYHMPSHDLSLEKKAKQKLIYNFQRSNIGEGRKCRNNIQPGVLLIPALNGAPAVCGNLRWNSAAKSECHQRRYCSLSQVVSLRCSCVCLPPLMSGHF